MRDFRFSRGDYYSGWQFFGRLSDHKFDLGTFKTGIFTTATVLSYPMTANVAVQVKDYKYRVTVSNRTSARLIFDDVITQKGRSLIKKSKANIKMASMLDQDLTDKFDLNKSIISGDF